MESTNTIKFQETRVKKKRKKNEIAEEPDRVKRGGLTEKTLSNGQRKDKKLVDFCVASSDLTSELVDFT